MKVLVTGGAGFIGHHVVEQLLKRKHSVRVFDRSDRPFSNEGVEYFRGDLSEKDKLCDSLRGQDAVIHMASLLSVPESNREKRKYEKNIFSGSINLLESMKKESVKKIVYSSSAAIYGEPKVVPIREDDRKIPNSFYGKMKLRVERSIRKYQREDGIDGVCLRYFNAYGPGERHNPEEHVIPNFIVRFFEGAPLKITGSRKQVRDYVYVEDLARAHVDALNLRGFNAFNLGSGSGHSLEELISIFEEIFGRKVGSIDALPREGDVMSLVADISKAKEFLKWEPRVCLRDGLKKTIGWFRENYFGLKKNFNLS